jgi:hypothetical protein
LVSENRCIQGGMALGFFFFGGTGA